MGYLSEECPISMIAATSNKGLEDYLKRYDPPYGPFNPKYDPFGAWTVPARFHIIIANR